MEFPAVVQRAINEQAEYLKRQIDRREDDLARVRCVNSPTLYNLYTRHMEQAKVELKELEEYL